MKRVILLLTMVIAIAITSVSCQLANQSWVCGVWECNGNKLIVHKNGTIESILLGDHEYGTYYIDGSVMYGKYGNNTVRYKLLMHKIEFGGGNWFHKVADIND